MNHPDTLAY